MQSIAETLRMVLGRLGGWQTVKDVRAELHRTRIVLPIEQSRLGNYLYKLVQRGYAVRKKENGLIEYRLLDERVIPEQYRLQRQKRNKRVTEKRRAERARIADSKKGIPYSFEVHMICQRRWS